MTIEEAKDFLKSKGYFVSNLWHVDDVKTLFKCTDDEAQEVLEEALTSDSTYDAVWFNISFYGRDQGLPETEYPA